MTPSELLVVTCPDGKARSAFFDNLNEARINVKATHVRPGARCPSFGCPGGEHKLEGAVGFVKAVDLDGSMLPF